MAGTGTQEDVLNDRPIATRRKRRTSTALADSAEDTDHNANTFSNADQVAKTPTKPKKRIRFSDPGPNSNAGASSSTSLTPAMRRSKLSVRIPTPNPPKLRLPSEHTKRRSVPARLPSSFSSSSVLLPATPVISGEVQFKPLRQALDERLKRRLRRNNLSEEMNNIYSEKKSRLQWEREIRALKDELAEARARGNDALDGEASNTERIRELEEEIITVKQELRERSPTVGPPPSFEQLGLSSAAISILGDGHDEDHTPMASLDEDIGVQDNASGEAAEAATQVSLTPPSDLAAFRSARMSLEYLFPGEISLGLDMEEPKPILDTMLDKLQAFKAQATIAAAALSTTKTQEANLRKQFNAVLQQLDRARNNAETLTAKEANEKTRGDYAERRVQQLELSIEQGSEKIRHLESEVDEKQRSIQKLQDALETYRTEVGKLEGLITSFEEEYNKAISNLRAEMNEAVTDLECHVAAEMTGRRAAEKEAVDRGHRIKQLEQSELELKGAMSEKQKTIRDMEKEITNGKESEKEVGVMNVTIGRITSNLDEANTALAGLAAEKQRLIVRLEEEKAAGTQAIEAMQAEMARCSETVEHVKETHFKDMQSRGVEVAQHRGLLTPVSTHKFKDVEGYVEIQRGKGNGRRRPDSGIGVLEEDEFEDFVDDDMSSTTERSSPLKHARN